MRGSVMRFVHAAGTLTRGITANSNENQNVAGEPLREEEGAPLHVQPRIGLEFLLNSLGRLEPPAGNNLPSVIPDLWERAAPPSAGLFEPAASPKLKRVTTSHSTIRGAAWRRRLFSRGIPCAASSLPSRGEESYPATRSLVRFGGSIIVALTGIGCGLRRTGAPVLATRDSASST